MISNSIKNNNALFYWKIVLIVIVLFVILFLGIPLVLEMVVFGYKHPSYITNGEWVGFLGSYLGGIIGGGTTLLAIYFTTKETRRIERENQKATVLKEMLLNRGYLIVDEIDNLGLRLEGYDPQGDIRILETENYKELEKKVSEEQKRDIKMNYLRIKNVGPGLVINCEIKLRMSTENRDTYIDIKSSIPMIQVNQEIFILAQSIKLHPNRQFPTEVELNYMSIVAEEIRYFYKVPRVEGESISEKYMVKKGNRYEEIFKTHTEPVSWVFPAYSRTV